MGIDDLIMQAYRGDAEAKKAVREAAEHGNVAAQVFLGSIYSSGFGEKENLSEAEYWFQKAADEGDANAQFGLSICYLKKNDYANAQYWAEKAAAQGLVVAKEALETTSRMLKTPGFIEAQKPKRIEKRRIDMEKDRAERDAAFQGGEFVSVSHGYGYHSVGLKADGTAKAIGCNKNGECDVDGEEWRDLVAVAAGWHHTVGLKRNGMVVSAGDNSSDQRNVGDWQDIVAIAVGYNHTVGLNKNGTVHAVGGQDHGKCLVGKWRDIISISANENCTSGVRADGTVIRSGWGHENMDMDAFLKNVPPAFEVDTPNNENSTSRVKAYDTMTRSGCGHENIDMDAFIKNVSSSFEVNIP